MTIPREYGGHGRSHLDRYVVTEELLAAGSPVAAHWVADRQVGPALMRYGTEEQRHRYLPGIALGETYFAIGMSEPESGSDLASVQTRAVKVDGGWEVKGTKVWTSGAQHATAFFVLARSEPLDPAHRHAGLEPVHRRAGLPWHRDPSDPAADRAAPLQRGGAGQRVCARRARPGPVRRRLDPGHLRAGHRAQRTESGSSRRCRC
jgi:alkylation response protein AidB-like acyl-CoA dehydrogenase